MGDGAAAHDAAGFFDHVLCPAFVVSLSGILKERELFHFDFKLGS